MADIIMSIHPNWADKIYAGEKTIEWRKSRLKTYSEETKIYMYETSPVKMVTGCFTLKTKFINTPDPDYPFARINFRDSDAKHLMIENIERMGCVPIGKLREYLKDSDGYGWRINKVEKFEKPMPLSEFGLKRPPQSWQYLPEKELGEMYTINGEKVTKEEFFKRAKLAGLFPNSLEEADWVKSVTRQPKDGSWISYQTEKELFVVSRLGEPKK